MSAASSATMPDLAAVKTRQQAAFPRDLLILMESRNVSGDRTLVLPSEYLEIVIERK